MNAPPRLLNDPDVAESLKKDLQCAVDHQLNYDVAAGLARFEAGLASGAVTGAAAQGAMLKWLVVGVAGAGVVATLYLSSNPSTSNPSPAPAAPSPQFTEQVPNESLAPRSSEAAAEPETIRAEDLEVEQETKAPIKMTQPAAPTAPAEAEQPAPSRDDLLQREVAHLKSVRQALAGDPTRALQLANAGHAEFQGGVLYQEREALALQALNALGQSAELQQRGDRYLKSFPSGSFSDQVRGMLKR